MQNSANRQPSLKQVHSLIAEKKYKEALEILHALNTLYPEFNLYKKKLDEIEKFTLQEKKYLDKNSNDSTQNKNTLITQKSVNDGLSLLSQGRVTDARKILSKIYENNKNDTLALVALAKVDLLDQRFSDALHKAKVAISLDQNNREAYRVAEQAAIELERFDEANHFFLSQPKINNPEKPIQRGSNPSLPPQFQVPPIIGAGNDYRHILEKALVFNACKKAYTKKVSVIVPVYNRKQILANTLAALTHQTYPKELTEIIVVDDGSNDNVFDVIKKYEEKLNLYYSRQADKGYRLAAARNIGLREATGDAFVFMDADILPLPEDIEKYMQVMHVSDDSVLIGHRRYVDTSLINDDIILNDINVAINLKDINPNNDVADRRDSSGASIDWRFPIYQKTNFLIDDPWPFTKGAGGNLAFSRELLHKAGYVDEDFAHWGCEDGEHNYRLYNAGAYFIPMMNIISLHQEPLNENPQNTSGESFRKRGHEITKKIFAQKCPAPTVRQYLPSLTFEIPKISIYIPAYNAAAYIKQAVQSCLNQSFGDLEVCICDDGSTDNTLEVLQDNFRKNPKVRWVTQENGGIGKATNTAIAMCRGMYIAQLDADDLLKPHAVRACVEILDKSIHLDAVYADCDYIDKDGEYIRDGWCGGEFSRDWMATGMIATHFRMFRKRLWSRTTGCNERIKNAVDLDLWLKLFERGNIDHIHQILYSYRWHGENTSIQHRKQQEQNHLKVVADSLKRQKLDRFWMVQPTGNKFNPREFKIVPLANSPQVRPEDVILLIPTCKKYFSKAEAVRKTWASQLKDYGYRYLFLVGNPELSKPELAGDILSLPCKDDYESLLLKLALGYEFVYRTMDFTHIYKIDDDCYLNIKKLTNDILPQLAGLQYAGGATHPKGAKMNSKWHFGKCSDPRFDKPYKFDCAPFEFAKGGYGYFLRRDIIPVIIAKISNFSDELKSFEYSFEDVRISEILGAHSITTKKLSDYTVSHAEKPPFSDVTIIYDIKDSDQFSIIHSAKN